MVILLVGDAITSNSDCKQIGTILSKYHTVDAFNVIPNTAEVGWPIYKMGNSLIIRITSWFPLIFAPNANPSAWIYSYPIVKSLVEMLKDLEVRNIEYICSGETMDELKSSKSIIVRDDGRWARIIPAWATKDEKPSDVFVSTPSWSIPHMAKLFGVACNVTCVINKDGTIDEQKQTAIDFYKYFNKGIGHWDIDTTKKGIGQKKIESTVEDLKRLRTELNIDKVPIYKKSDEGVMFG